MLVKALASAPRASKAADICRALRVGVTFLLVNCLWVLFRAESFAQAGMVFSGMLSFGSVNLGQIATLVLDNAFDFPTIVDIGYLFALLAVLLTVVFRYTGLYPEGVTYAILLSNAAAPLIDRWTAPVRFGTQEGGQTE